MKLRERSSPLDAPPLRYVSDSEEEEDEDEEAEEENIESPQRFNGEHYRTLDGRISHRFLPQNASFSTRLYCKIGLEFDPSHLLDDEQK